MSEEDIAASVADQIMRSAGIKPQADLTDEQLQELEERRKRYRHYWRRQEEERRQEERANLIAAQRQAEEAERRRIAEVKDANRQRVAEHARRINERYRSKPGPSQTEIEWATFKGQLAKAQAEQQRKAQFERVMKSCDEMIASINPLPPEPEPQVVYVSQSADPWNDFHFGATDLRKPRW